MRNFLLGLGVALVVLALGVGARASVAWKHYIDVRSFYAGEAGAYLFGPSGAVDSSGKAVSRQQLLDAFLHQQIEAHPEWGLHFAK